MFFLNFIFERINETINYLKNHYIISHVYNLIIITYILNNSFQNFVIYQNLIETIDNNRINLLSSINNKFVNFNLLNFLENLINKIFKIYSSNYSFNFISTYVNTFLKNLFYLFFNIFLNFFIFIKIFIINNLYNQNFVIDKVLFYTDLSTNIDITEKFKNITLINKTTILNLYDIYNLNFILNDNIRIKIFFRFKNIKYIIYFPYNIYKNSNIINDDKYYLQFPLYSDDVMKNYRNDIIFPSYTENYKKKILYPLFSMECKNIYTVEINNTLDKKIFEYIEMIKTPFNDFGILYNIPVKLNWLLSENNINMEKFNSFYLKFLNLYLDEENMELKEHYIELDNKNIDKFIISDRIKEIISKKNI